MMVKSRYNTGMDNNERQMHKITLSLPRELWEAMTALAREHQCSFTKELIWALQEYIRRERRQQHAEQQS
jgi:hypothetical protein